MQDHATTSNGDSVPPSTGPTIHIVDIQNAVRAIDFAAEQGAYKGWAVITQVKAMRDRLDEFVVAAMPPDEETAPVAGAVGDIE